ncbi:MAG: hypothetical protein KA941_13610 [Flavobacteriales bacterium]|nr:hypothetical protein [Flavobacteriales bacterium]
MTRRSDSGSVIVRNLVLTSLLWSACSEARVSETVAEQDSAPAVISQAADTSSRNASAQDKEEQQTTFFIQDSTQYSTTFLAAFRDRNAWIHRHIELRNDSMVVDGDTPGAIILPTDLPLKKMVRYAREWNGRRYRLDLTRLNISTVSYRYAVGDGRTTLFEGIGTADLDPSFHGGAEGVFEDAGQTFGMNKYHPNDTTCQDYLLIGHGSIAQASYIRVGTNAKDTLLSMGMNRR